MHGQLNVRMYVGSVQYVVSLLFASLCYFIIIHLMLFNIPFMFVSLFCIFVFYFVYSVILYCFKYCFTFCIWLSLSYFVQVCRPLPPDGNPTAVNK